MAKSRPDPSDEIVGESIPRVFPPPRIAKPDVSAPWYRPAKQYLRREQWNASILQLLSKLPPKAAEEERTLRYVGLPGQHHLDVLSMGGICNQRKLRLDYLGFRTGEGNEARAVYLEELSILSRSKYFTPNSITYPDNVENIGRPNSLANVNFDERGPFDIINLDACGGILHGDEPPFLNAIKYVLTSQAVRQHPWLLFVTTAAISSHIASAVIAKFFSTVNSNCEKVAKFKDKLASAVARHGLPFDLSLSDPAGLAQQGFLRLFTLAFGKWLLANLDLNRPPAAVSLHSAYCFRNSGRSEPEMLSLAYMVSPIIGGGDDPTGLTGRRSTGQKDEYANAALDLVAKSIDRLQDLDEVWDDNPVLKKKVISECERLLRIIGVDKKGLREWHARYPD